MNYSKAEAEVILFDGVEFMALSGEVGGGIYCIGFDCTGFSTTGQGASGKFTCRIFNASDYNGVKVHGGTYQCHYITRK